jgi:hypothetical protein
VFHLDDLLGNDTIYSLDEIVSREGPDVVLITTHFLDEYQRYESISHRWLPQKKKRVYVPISKILDIEAKVVARIRCRSPLKQVLLQLPV